MGEAKPWKMRGECIHLARISPKLICQKYHRIQIKVESQKYSSPQNNRGSSLKSEFGHVVVVKDDSRP